MRTFSNIPIDSSEPLLTLKRDGWKPSLGHGAIPVPFDISLTVGYGRKHALDGIRTSQGLP